jgi:hypothetical protein
VCFTTANMIIREYFSAEQVSFGGFFNWKNTYEIISAYFPLLPKRSRSIRWPCCLYMLASKLSDQLIDATNLYISITQTENKRRYNVVEMRTLYMGMTWRKLMYVPAVICDNGFCKNMHLSSQCTLCIAGCDSCR